MGWSISTTAPRSTAAHRRLARWTSPARRPTQFAGTFIAAYDEYRRKRLPGACSTAISSADALRRHMKALRAPGANFGLRQKRRREELYEVADQACRRTSEPPSRHWPRPRRPETSSDRNWHAALHQVGIVWERLRAKATRRLISVHDGSQFGEGQGRTVRPVRDHH